jgi:DNA polymerase III alpha subunit
MFIHLTMHSTYSLQEVLPLPTELARAGQASGIPALGLTDHCIQVGVSKMRRVVQ